MVPRGKVMVDYLGGGRGMTICVSVKVRDGIILGTDSMAQISVRQADGQVNVVKSYANAHKLFQVSPTMGVMSYGIGNFGPRSLENLIIEFRKSQDWAGKPTFDVAKALYGFLKERYDNAYPPKEGVQRPQVGFFVAGYSDGSPFADEYEFVIPSGGEIKLTRPKEGFGTSWRGERV